MIPFGDWAPDQADLNTQVAKDIKNVLPGDGCYAPAQSITEISAALPAACVGACVVRTTTGGLAIFAGTTTKLYKYGNPTWTDVTRLVGGNYAVGAMERWEFTQFGDNLIATNISDVMQTIGITSGTNFANLGGTPPQARHVTTVGPHVVASGISGAPNQVRWSAVENSAGWTIGTNRSDSQDFPDGGDCLRVSGRESGLVIQKEAVRQMVYQPTSNLVFTFQRVEDIRGSPARYSPISVGTVTFFYGLDGFSATQGGQSVPIGSGYVNEWFRTNASGSKLSTMVGVADPRSTRALWFFASTDGGSAPYDTIIGYDWARKKWFYTKQQVEYIMAAATLGITLDGMTVLGLTLDTLPASLDSPIWQGGIPGLAGFTTNHKMGFFDGATLEATLETAEFQPTPGARSFTSGCTPFIDSENAVISIGTRETFQAPTVYGAEAVREVNGNHSRRASGKFFRAKARIPADDTWTKAMGLDLNDVEEDGDR